MYIIFSYLVGQWHWVFLVRGVPCPPHYQLFSRVIGWKEGEEVPLHLSVTLSVKKEKKTHYHHLNLNVPG